MEFGMVALWNNMGAVAKGVVIVLALMSIWTVKVSIDRFLLFRKARKESIDFLPLATQCLKNNKLREAVELAKKYRRSHLSRVIAAGLQEMQSESEEGVEGGLMLDAVRRSMDREMILVSTDLKKGISSLATIGTTAPFIGLFGTVYGIIHAFQSMATSGSGGLASVSAGIAEALVTTAFGLFVAIPAVWIFNIFTGRVDYFVLEMNNSSSEMIDFFIKKQNVPVRGQGMGAHAGR
ncbi:MAG TPA: MotA/TolQ/ExbB proton channel family protein [Candidatus Polarisedimenticolia bacterium]|nr:MotA/TolQ/ExbB proton channel family protein [Candidatus Polarisedimenticolia bacterium]